MIIRQSEDTKINLSSSMDQESILKTDNKHDGLFSGHPVSLTGAGRVPYHKNIHCPRGSGPHILECGS